jgi:hypothetical protein
MKLLIRRRTCGPLLERIDVGLARSFAIREGKELRLEAQVFNLFNHPNYYVQNGNGINQLEYNPIGTDCGDGTTLNQTCYLAPKSGSATLGPCRKSAPTAYHESCSSRLDLPSRRSHFDFFC